MLLFLHYFADDKYDTERISKIFKDDKFVFPVNICSCSSTSTCSDSSFIKLVHGSVQTLTEPGSGSGKDPGSVLIQKNFTWTLRHNLFIYTEPELPFFLNLKQRLDSGCGPGLWTRSLVWQSWSLHVRHPPHPAPGHSVAKRSFIHSYNNSPLDMIQQMITSPIRKFLLLQVSF